MPLIRDIMINALMMAIPLLVNFIATGGYDALKAGNITAIVNLVAGVAALCVSISAFIIRWGVGKKREDVWDNIMSRKDGEGC